MAIKTINLYELKDLSYVPTASTCDAYAEAASVCLENQAHQIGVEFKVEGKTVTKEIKLSWKKVSQQMIDNWNDLQEATEYGATALALLIVHKFTKYKVIKRSRKRTGIDFWLGLKEDKFPFQNRARLEISGILKGSKSQINQRLKTKMEQTKQSDHLNLTAFIIVVEFSAPTAKIAIR
ncbi:MAG: hypothetical protein AB8B69_19405 [Chitinophagales bacterium]